MKKIIILLLPIFIFAKSFLISDIPLPKTYIQDLDPYPCDEVCLQEYIDRGMIFSFLAHADKKLASKELNEARMINISILNIGSNITVGKLRIAMLLPYKIIGRYAASTTNSVFAYLIAKNRAFELKSYKIESENIEDMESAVQDIQKDGFAYVIAPLTKKGVDVLNEIDPQLYVYVPTINKNDLNSSSIFFTYGGIDYKAQSDMLLKEAVSPLVIFHDKSAIGRKLSIYEEKSFKKLKTMDKNITDMLENTETNMEFAENVEKVLDENTTYEENITVVSFSIPRRTTNLEKELKDNLSIAEGSFFLNTPIVKSGMIMSQLTLYDLNATNILSTQINYDPLLLSMTQYSDRKNMIIANSITKKNNFIAESNALLGNDIVYDWINYTTVVGVDYFFNLITGEAREYNIDIQDNQMIYKIELVQPSLSRFIKYMGISKNPNKLSSW